MNLEQCRQLKEPYAWSSCNYTTWKKEEIVGSTDTVKQTLETCFRCAEVGSTVKHRQETTTYIPSFKISHAEKCTALQKLLDDSPMFSNLISKDCHVNIYVATLNDLIPEFNKAIKLDVHYLGPMIKPSIETMADGSNFKKINEEGQTDPDQGAYAAREAYKKHGGPPWREATLETIPRVRDTLDNSIAPPAVSAETLAALEKPLPRGGTSAIQQAPMASDVAEGSDMDALMNDANCENPAISDDETVCEPPTQQVFVEGPDLEAEQLALMSNQSLTTTTTSTTTAIACNSCCAAGPTNGTGTATGGWPDQGAVAGAAVAKCFAVLILLVSRIIAHA